MDGHEEPLLPFSTSSLERAGLLRRDAAFLAEARSHPGARVLLVADQMRVPVEAPGELAWGSLSDPGEAESAVLLGIDDQDRPLFSRDARPEEIDERFAPLREIGADLREEDAAAALQAAALSAWHRRAPFCPTCGGPTAIEDAGHRRRCLACGAGHFPRTDPAVIMLVTDGDRCVLGRRAGAPANRWSTLAGFVEAGESLEAAVAREVHEEVGLRVHATRYRGSQPWPFPASLMVAFEADAPYGPLSLSDEHHEVRWFTRDEVAGSIAAGQMIVPGAIAAGGFLIRSWLSPAQRPAETAVTTPPGA